jgi:hypothetical protein
MCNNRFPLQPRPSVRAAVINANLHPIPRHTTKPDMAFVRARLVELKAKLTGSSMIETRSIFAGVIL